MLVTVLVDVDVGLERVTHCNAITSADATKDAELRSVLDVAGEFDDLAVLGLVHQMVISTQSKESPYQWKHW